MIGQIIKLVQKSIGTLSKVSFYISDEPYLNVGHVEYNVT